MGTIYDVARLAGVSTATVSRYVNRSSAVRPATAARIEAAIAETGYVPSRAASSLTTKRSGLVGFLTSDLTNPFTSELAHAMTDEAGRTGLSLLSAVTFGLDERFEQLAGELRRHQVDGIVATPPGSPRVVETLRAVAASGVPVVTVGITVPESPVDFVSVDTYAGARDAMHHLLDLGHRRIALLTGTPHHEIAASRFRGYADALAEAGVEVSEELVYEGTTDADFGFEAMHEIAETSPAPTAIFAINDLIALGVLQACHHLGIRVPEQLSVVGFDDIWFAGHSSPPLTTVAQPRSRLGTEAIRLLIERMTDPHRETAEIRLPSDLVLRRSTAPPRRRRTITARTPT